MPIVTKHYFLPDDETEYKIDSQSNKMYYALDDIRDHLRTKSRYPKENTSETELKVWEEMYETFFDIINNRYVDMDIE